MSTIRQFSHVHRANAVSMVLRDLSDHKVKSDLMEMMAHPDHRACKVNVAQLDQRDEMANKVSKVHVVNRDLLARQVHPV